MNSLLHLMGMKRRGVALLLEAIFGLGLFAVALLVSVGLIVVVSKGSTAAREYELAEQVGRQYLELYLEQYRVSPPGSYPLNIPSFPAVATYYNGGSVHQLNLSVNATVSAPAGKPFKDVVVNVTWDTGMPRQTLLEGYLGF
ncbi:MAG: hypothetical protein U0931_13200 [Vulcanimicrobiota bacterium]